MSAPSSPSVPGSDDDVESEEEDLGSGDEEGAKPQRKRAKTGSGGRKDGNKRRAVAATRGDPEAASVESPATRSRRGKVGHLFLGLGGF